MDTRLLPYSVRGREEGVGGGGGGGGGRLRPWVGVF